MNGIEAESSTTMTCEQCSTVLIKISKRKKKLGVWSSGPGKGKIRWLSFVCDVCDNIITKLKNKDYEMYECPDCKTFDVCLSCHQQYMDTCEPPFKRRKY